MEVFFGMNIYEGIEGLLLGIVSCFFGLFAVIDIFGNVPMLLSLRDKYGEINARKAILVSGGILLVFLFSGKGILDIVGVDVASFSVAGSILFFFFAFELILGVSLFKYDEHESKVIEIVPIAFPLLAGPGSLTILISLRANHSFFVIFVALLLNLIIAYFIIKYIKYIAKLLGRVGIGVLRRVFGIILLAIAVKIFTTNIGYFFSNSKESIEKEHKYK